MNFMKKLVLKIKLKKVVKQLNPTLVSLVNTFTKMIDDSIIDKIVNILIGESKLFKIDEAFLTDYYYNMTLVILSTQKLVKDLKVKTLDTVIDKSDFEALSYLRGDNSDEILNATRELMGDSINRDLMDLISTSLDLIAARVSMILDMVEESAEDNEFTYRDAVGMYLETVSILVMYFGTETDTIMKISQDIYESEWYFDMITTYLDLISSFMND